RAALDPVAVVAIEHAVDVGELSAVDVAADDAVDARFARGSERRILISPDEALRAGETRLQDLRERPIRPVENVVQPVHEPMQREQAATGEAAEPDAQRATTENRVELIAMRDEQSAAVSSRVDRL